MFQPPAYTPATARPFTHPEARVIHPVAPPRATLAGLTPAQRADAYRAHRLAWLKLRTEGIGSAAASTLAGLNPHSSLLALFAEKTGRTPLGEDTDVTRIGRDLEEPALERFRQATGLRTRRVGMVARRDCAWMMATPDALTDDGAGVEIKTTTERQSSEWDAQPSDHAMAQAQWSMWVTGLAHWYICVLFRDTGRFLWYRVERDQHMVDVLRERAAVFWHSHVLTDTAPPLDGSDADLEAVAHLAQGTDAHPAGEVEGGEAAAVVGRALRRIGERERELRALKKRWRAEFARLVGNGETLLAYGIPVGTYRRNGTMATARYLEQGARAHEFLEPQPVLNVERALEEDPEAILYVSRKLSLKPPARERRDEMVPPVQGGELAWLEAATGAA